MLKKGKLWEPLDELTFWEGSCARKCQQEAALGQASYGLGVGEMGQEGVEDCEITGRPKMNLPSAVSPWSALGVNRNHVLKPLPLALMLVFFVSLIFSLL